MPVDSVVSTDAGDSSLPAAKMLPVTSVFSSESSDGSAPSDHAATSDLPFTHAAAGDASDAAGLVDAIVADLGLSDGWYFA